MKKCLLALVTATLFSSHFNYINAQESGVIMEQISTPVYLYKVVSKEQWEESQLQQMIMTSAQDKDFIHLATEDQVAHIVKKFWHRKDYIILKLLTTSLSGCLIYETNPGGTTFYYHLYDGIIPLDAVIEIQPA